MLIRGINGQQLDFGRVKMEAGFWERATAVLFSLFHTHTHMHMHAHTHTHTHTSPCPWRRCGGPCILPQNGKDFSDTVWRAQHVSCAVGRPRRLVSNSPPKSLKGGRQAGWLLMYLPRICDCFERPASQSHLGWNASVWPLAGPEENDERKGKRRAAMWASQGP